MPITVKNLLESEQLEIKHHVKWNDKLPLMRTIRGQKSENKYSGVYIISLSSEADKNDGLLDIPEFNLDAVKNWMNIASEIKVDGEVATVEKLIERLKEFWLPDENILYIGKSDRPVRRRLSEFYKQTPGYKKTHAGGFWLKLIMNLYELNVYTAEIKSIPKWYVDFNNNLTSVEIVESILLKRFMDQVSNETLCKLRDKILPLPFANLEYKPLITKEHALNHRFLKDHKLENQTVKKPSK